MCSNAATISQVGDVVIGTSALLPPLSALPIVPSVSVTSNAFGAFVADASGSGNLGGRPATYSWTLTSSAPLGSALQVSNQCTHVHTTKHNSPKSTARPFVVAFPFGIR
jgi:hypothetical protein